MLKAGAGKWQAHMQLRELREVVPAAPASWMLGQRTIRTTPEVVVVWKLGVNKLASTAQLSLSCSQAVASAK